jgi:hypothetical protein
MPIKRSKLTRVLFVVDQLHNKNTPTSTDREYLKMISTIPILKREPVFTDYSALVEKESDHTFFHRQLPIPGVSTFEVRNNTILFTFHNDIYVGEIGKVRTKFHSIRY